MTDSEALVCPSCHTANVEGAEVCFHCGMGLHAMTEGTVLSYRYEIVMPLGRGGMGMVYKAHDRELDEVVAVKVLRREAAGSSDAARRFRSEIKLARKVRHRNVCGIHEYGQHGPVRYIVMEYIDGVDLKQLLRREGPMVAHQAYAVAIQIADGLQSIHEQGIVHRDLKTPNIMQDARGVIRLMDFGIAKQFNSDRASGATSSGNIVGTPEYMSPEQARGERVDERTDIYALGIVLYELFTADLPFRGDTPLATLMKHVQEPPPLDSPAAALLPPAAKAIVGRALAKTPAERYATARELAAELRRAWNQLSEPRFAGPAPHFERDATARQPEPLTERMPTPLPTPIPTPTPAGIPATWKANVPAAASTSDRTPDRPAALTDRDGGAAPSGSRTPLPTILLVGAGSVVVMLAVWAMVAMRSNTTPAVPAPLDSPAPVQVVAATATPATLGARIAVERPASPAPSALRAPRERAGSSPSSPRPAPSMAPPADAAAPNTGLLSLVVKPYAEVVIDGRIVGTTPAFTSIRLPAGTYTVRLIHPDYLPLPKRVVIHSGETASLDVDLAEEAFRR